MYVFRCLIGEEIPLNSGVLEPVENHPADLPAQPAGRRPTRASSPAVVGGNVETSQRVVDALLGALGVAAASQGTMNNLTFGDATFGYYETICGGSGATRDADGADAVHTHMTNTRLDRSRSPRTPLSGADPRISHPSAIRAAAAAAAAATA